MEVSVKDLREGDVISRNIFEKSGKLLVRRGTVVTPLTIEQLKDYNKGILIDRSENSSKVKVDSLKIGDYIAKTVTDKNGIVIVRRGTCVDKDVLRKLKDFKGDISIQKPTDTVDEIKEEIEPTKVLELSDKAKKEIVDGMQFIFGNADSDEAIDAAFDVSNVIIDEIESSEAVYIDLDKLELFDDYTFRHSVDVAMLACFVSMCMKKDRKYSAALTVSGLMHDIGKIKIPLEIINKPGKLTDEEFDIMKRHPYYGYAIVRDKRYMPQAAKMGVLEHHERYDGKGYPFGASGNSISEFGRRLCVVDVYDALVTDRPYRPKKSPPVTLDIMWNNMRGNFDQILYKEFVSCLVLYPTGAMVKLSNGEDCIVVSNNDGYPYSPCVRSSSSGRYFDLLRDPTLRDVKVVVQ